MKTMASVEKVQLNEDNRMLDHKVIDYKQFVSNLDQDVKEGKFEKALRYFEDANYEHIINQKSWDIVQLILSYLKSENVQNADLINCCELMLNAITQICNPSEMVLELLEQIEYDEEDLKFYILLKPLAQTLNKMVDMTKAIGWCTSTIKSYIEGMLDAEMTEVDEISGLVGEESKYEHLLQRIQNIYNAILTFLETLISGNTYMQMLPEQKYKMECYLASILIYLFGKPFCYLSNDIDSSNAIKDLSEKIITLVRKISGDLLKFLYFVRKREINNSRKQNKRKSNANNDNYSLETILFEFTENIPQVAYANFYYNIITIPALCRKVPHVYDIIYIFQSCLYLVNNLLGEPEIVLIKKGIVFMRELLQRTNKCYFTREMLELKIYVDVADALIKVMIYCKSKKQRTEALEIFKKYIDNFNMESRYSLILYLYETVDHSGLLSFITSIVKRSIVECLESEPQAPYFLGSKLKYLLKSLCKLPHGSATDLVEVSDEIITNLNLLRFLFLRDKNNSTGVWDMVQELETNYFKPIKEGISLCKAHWMIKIKDLEEQKRLSLKIGENVELEKAGAEIALMVGGEKLPPMSINQKIQVCHQAYNGLDVMESLVTRLCECIADNPLKKEIQ